MPRTPRFLAHQGPNTQFAMDILPSIFCFTLTTIWFFSDKPSFFSLPYLHQTAALLIIPTTTLYLLLHPFSQDISVLPSHKLSPTQRVLYNLTRSLLHGLAATMMASYTALHITREHFPGHENIDFRDFRSQHTRQCYLFLGGVFTVWLVLLGGCWAAALVDFGEWDRLAEEMRTKRGEQNKFYREWEERVYGSQKGVKAKKEGGVRRWLGEREGVKME